MTSEMAMCVAGDCCNRLGAYLNTVDRDSRVADNFCLYKNFLWAAYPSHPHVNTIQASRCSNMCCLC